MNIDFNSSHMKTLAELQALADKHNCIIRFGVNSNSLQAEDATDLLNCPEDIKEELNENCDFGLEYGSTFSVWFYLRDKEHETDNGLDYSNIQALFRCKLYSYATLSEKAQKWLEENMCDWCDDFENCFLAIDKQKEKTYGFEGVTQQGWCYRTGMILAVFAQLVCDYLGEERIKRTY